MLKSLLIERELNLTIEMVYFGTFSKQRKHKMLLLHFRIFFRDRNRTAGRRNGLTVEQNMNKYSQGNKRKTTQSTMRVCLVLYWHYT